MLTSSIKVSYYYSNLAMREQYWSAKVVPFNLQLEMYSRKDKITSGQVRNRKARGCGHAGATNNTANERLPD